MIAGHVGFGMVFLVIAVAGVVLATSFALSTRPALAAPVSETIKHSLEPDFIGAQLVRLTWQDYDASSGGGSGGRGAGRNLVLEKGPGGYAPSGTVTSKPLSTAFPFNNVVLSWNILAPEGTGAIVEVRAGSDASRWTGWYEIARWGRLRSPGAPGLKKDESGFVNEDTLELGSKASLLQYRITLISEDRDATPVLKLVAACYADTSSEAAVPAFAPPRDPAQAPWVRDLPVPFRSQRSEDPSIAGRICSPTCVAMVLEYHGVAVPTATVAAQAYDSLNSIYGNWPFNTAAAALYGLDAYVTRFSGFEPVQDEIAAGRPVIISIRFGPGQLKGGPLNSTSGHLIVVRGFTKDGDVIVNDPAGRTEAEGHVVYKRHELLRAWKNGVAYIIRPVTP
ncbi:MAG: peptidase C39 family protein [Bacillota bacterium]|nr:peptidase C39 family protein [Bacillota bacterium]